MPEYDIRTLAHLTHLKPRTVRLYVAEKLLPRPVLRGAKTTYTDEHLVRIKAVQHLIHGERLAFPAIRTRLAKMSLADIDAMVPKVPTPEPMPTEAASSPSPPGSALPASVAALPSGGPPAASLPSSTERWDRVALLPGLELHVRGNAGAVVRRIAAEIAASYGAVEGPDPVV